MPYSNIDSPKKYFEAKTYTGTGSTQSISNLSFSPDFVWIKSRSNASYHSLDDIVRGAGKTLFSNTTDAETTYTDAITSFNSDGWTMGTDGSGGSVNVSARTYVGWAWDANGTGVSNTSGTITSTVSANTTSGFSIVSYTGTGANATVGHGLGVAPKMIILKNRTNGAADWRVYHTSVGNTVFLKLNTTGATVTASTAWNNTTPTSSVFSVGTSADVNENTATFIAYCFADVKGYSKFGSYTGNGSDNGTFVYTGFKPAFVLVKRTDSTGYWYLWDSARRTYNYNGLTLFPNDSSAESSYTPSNPVVDFLSNGFKLRGSYPETNASGGTIIYMAFAENPFVSSKGIPTTAR